MATRIASIAMGSTAKAEGDYSFAEGNGTVQLVFLLLPWVPLMLHKEITLLL